MNFSSNMKPRCKRRGTYWRDFVIGLITGALIVLLFVLEIVLCVYLSDSSAGTPVEPPTEPATSCPSITVTNDPTPAPSPSMAPENVSLGPCRITAYCACEKCCGEWAKNRPDGVVYGAAGIALKAGVSCASPWPVGTVVEIEGLGEYTVHDRPAQWVIDKYGENQFDIYFDSHEAARLFGLQYINVTVKECNQ